MPASSSIAVPSGRLQPARAQLGEEQRDAEARPALPISMRDHRGDQRAVDRRQRAELLGDRVPVSVDEEAEAERAQRRQRPTTSETMTPPSSEQHEEREQPASAAPNRRIRRRALAAIGAVAGAGCAACDRYGVCTASTVHSATCPVDESCNRESWRMAAIQVDPRAPSRSKTLSLTCRPACRSRP